MTGNEWINAFAAEVGADAPSPDDIDRLLALGGTAAHARNVGGADRLLARRHRAGQPTACPRDH